MRRAAKVDNNHQDIVAALQAIGCSVCDLSAAHNGIPDLLVGIGPQGEGKGINVLIEVKNGQLPPSKQTLTPQQAIFHKQWRGPLHVVNSVDMALAVINKCRKNYANRTLGPSIKP